MIRDHSPIYFYAAQILIDKNLYAPSVPRTYYSCFQLMKYIMNNFFGISYDELNQRVIAACYMQQRRLIFVAYNDK
jgi:hypothetical protein